METIILYTHTHLFKLLQKAYVNTTDDLPLLFLLATVEKISKSV